MSPKLTFLYDGQCPFCNQFAELLELKSNLPNIQVKNARDNPAELPTGYDMDIKGAVLLKDDQILHGAEAIHCICSNIDNPSSGLLKILSITFASNQRTKPVMLSKGCGVVDEVLSEDVTLSLELSPEETEQTE